MTALAYADDVLPHAAGYAPTSALVTAWRSARAVRVWRLGARIVSLQLSKQEGGGIWKARERFHMQDPYGMLDALERVGVYHPSSYADCYHKLAPSTRIIPWTFNGMFLFWRGGPWEEARQKGSYGGDWWRYDLISAYRWAATLGLPNPESYRAIEHSTRANKPGLWIFEPSTRTQARNDLPAVYRGKDIFVASTEDIDGYRMTGKILRGVTWDTMHPGTYVDDTLNKLPCGKQSARAYWGRWVARDRLAVWTAKREWQLKSFAANFVWGWLIVGRVRMRVWEQSAKAAHVYVDEVVVPHTIDTGNRPGHWHLKEHYPDGIDVHRTGHYGARNSQPAMQTGVKKIA